MDKTENIKMSDIDCHKHTHNTTTLDRINSS